MVPEVVDRLIESGRVPDPLLRLGIRANLRTRLARERRKDESARRSFVDGLRSSPIAVETRAANEQHYEVPPAFFELILGPRLKYSSCWWPEGVETLAEAESAMLELTCARAGIEDGMTILDLGCGWGSLSLWLAEHYPSSRVLAVSNSASQRAFIQARRAGNVEVLTADVNVLELERRFDRIVSVEMLEHARNYESVLAKIASWLEPDGRFFCHVFTHRELAYAYDDGWMARRFFTGGTMPSDDLLPSLARELELVDRWRVPGTHYARTSEAWLERMAENRGEILEVLARTYGRQRAAAWYESWRVFFLACAELWGFRAGTEWLVSHYLFARSAGQGFRADVR